VPTVIASIQGSYEVRRADIKIDHDDIVHLIRSADGKPGRSEEKFRWFYEKPYEGPTIPLLLHHLPSNSTVGLIAIGSRRLLVNGQSISAGLMADLHVEAAHRSLLPALTLLRAATAAGLEEHGVLYGYPNTFAQPLMRRAGYELVAQFSRFVYLLRIANYLPNWIPKPIRLPIGLAADVVHWVRHALPATLARRVLATENLYAPPAVVGAHKARFLNWRFGPDSPQRCILLPAPASLETVSAGLNAVETRGDVDYVRFLPYSDPTAKDSARDWRLLLRTARRTGRASISFACTADAALQSRLIDAGFTYRDQRPVFAIWRAELASQLRGASWMLTDADEDE